MKALILAGGSGTRLRPTTKIINKHLLPVWDKPLVLHGIDALKDAGIEDMLLSVNDSYGFMELLGDGDDYGVHISYLYQHSVAGIAWAINEAKPWLGDEPFVVYLGDNIFADGIKNIIEVFRLNPLGPLVALKKVEPEMTSRYGVALMDSKQRITRFAEKPLASPSPLIVLGLYCLTPGFFKIFPRLNPSARGEYEITDALNLLMPVNYRFYNGTWWDCGTYSDILDATKYFKKANGG